MKKKIYSNSNVSYCKGTNSLKTKVSRDPTGQVMSCH